MSSGCDRIASPIQEGATTRVRKGNWAPAYAGATRLVARRHIPNQLVQGAAVGAARLACLLDGKVDARMRVPELLRGQRAVQRELGRGDLEALAVKLGWQRHSCSRSRRR